MASTTEAINALGRVEYSKWYRRGWRHSEKAKNPSLDNQPAGKHTGWAWEDGYMDHAGDRPKYHRRECLRDDHNDCETN